MRLAFVLFKYFPYGGLQRDFLRIAQACRARGHEIEVFCLIWEGPQPEDMTVHLAPVRALTRHARNEKFGRWFSERVHEGRFDAVVGFNKMAGLDVYYAADPCYQDKVLKQRHPVYRLSGRYRHFHAEEKAVFDARQHTRILMIAEAQIPLFMQHYGTPRERFHLLPPGIARDRQRPADADAIRGRMRSTLGIGAHEHLFLSVGSGFKTKGVDRSLDALATLPEALRARARLIVIGQDNPASFQQMASRLGLAERVTFMAGRDDIPQCLVAADTLLHPAHNENTGTVLLEAVVAGLPVIVTEVCGYAHYVHEASAGIVLPEPFSANVYLDAITRLMTASSEERAQWQANGVAFGQTADIYSMPDHAASIIESVSNARARTA